MRSCRPQHQIIFWKKEEGGIHCISSSYNALHPRGHLGISLAVVRSVTHGRVTILLQSGLADCPFTLEKLLDTQECLVQL